jgi:hypothetical protein
MKLHALALCLAGTMVTAVAVRADDTTQYHSVRSGPNGTTMVDSYSVHSDGMPYRYTTEEGWVREVIYPNLPTESYVASKVQDIVRQNEQEVADLRSEGARAHTAGWENISTVYDVMIQDHQRAIDQGSTWLTARNCDCPAMPSATTAADVAPEASVEKQIEMHQMVFNESLDSIHNERSSTVRGMLLMSAATAARHISLLETLDRDVSLGRHNLSAALSNELNPTASSDMLARIETEESALYKTTVAEVVITPAPEVVEAPEAPEAPQVAATPAPAPAPAPAATPAPAPAPTVVERRTFVNQPAKVLGQRQTTGRRRARRPAY